MTTHPIDRDAALQLARAALTSWGAGADLEIVGVECLGGWRFHARPTDPATTGGSDAVVRADDGTVHRVPSGASDAAIARLLER